MTLEKLQSEMVLAMKSGDKFRKGVISTAIAQIKNAAIDKGCRNEIPESIVDESLLKAKKVTQEMLDTCPESRADLLENYKKQMEIICEFAPTLITDEAQIKTIVLDFAAENNIELTKNNRGKLMGIISKCLKGKIDMGAVNKVVGGMLR